MVDVFILVPFITNIAKKDGSYSKIESKEEEGGDGKNRLTRLLSVHVLEVVHFRVEPGILETILG